MKRLIILTLFILAFGTNSFADEEKPPVPIEVNGDQVEYIKEDNKILGTGNIVVTYKDIKVTCDKATVWLDTKTVEAEGNVVITQAENLFKGDSVSYNFESKTAQVINAKAQAQPWYGAADDLEKLSDSEYVLKKGYVSTCDLDKPHYRLQAKKVRVFPGRKVEAFNVFFYIGKMPVLYLPYFISPIPERRPGFSVIPGYSKDWGAYVLTTTRYYFNENSKGNIHVDYRERKDLASGVDYKYNTDVIGKGYLRTYYMHERNLQADRIWDHEDFPTTERQRYRARYVHRWDIDAKTNIIGEYNKLSDKEIIKDYFYREYEQEPAPISYANIVRAERNVAINLFAQGRTNDFFTEVQRLPEAEINVMDIKLGDLPFFYKSETSVSNLDKKFASGKRDDWEALRSDSVNQFFCPLKLSDFLNIDPFVGSRYTYYSKDLLDNRDEVRGMLLTGMDISTNRIHRTYDVGENFMGLGIDKVRHTIFPSVSYNYSSKPTVSSGHLMQFDDVDSADQKNFFNLELTNKLQARYQKGDEAKILDLARLIVSTDYIINYENGKNKFSDVGSLLELRPYSGLYIELTSKYDPRRGKVERFTTDFIAEKKNLRVGLGHRYETDNSTQMTSSIEYSFNPKWSFRTYHRYEFHSNDMQEQEYSIIRDLHCWTVELVYNRGQTRGESVWVVFKLKAFPDMPIKMSTTYNAPKTSQPGMLY